MNSRWRIYGLVLHCNCQLPGLSPTSSDEPHDVDLEVIDGPPSLVPEVAAVRWSHEALVVESDSHWVETGTGKDGVFWRLWYGSDTFGRSTEFVIQPSGHKVWAFRQAWNASREPGTIQDLTTLMVGSVLGVELRLRGMLCLHACVVALGSHAIVILGEKGMGKSSLAAALCQRGHAVLSDDAAAVTTDGQAIVVQPGYPRLRLWPDSFRALSQSSEESAPVLSVLDKRYLELNLPGEASSWRFHDTALPLGAIFVLARRGETVAPVIEPLAATDGMRALTAHMAPSFLKLERNGRALEFETLARLARTVPLFSVGRPDGWEHMPALCEALEEVVGTAVMQATM
jgi:hypothetical protein